MAKTTTPATTAANNAPAAVINENLSPEMQAELEALESGEARSMEITSEYLSFAKWKEGDRKAFVFLGFTTMPDQQTGEMKRAVSLLGRDGVMYVNSTAVLVNACGKLKGSCGIVIVYEGQRKASTGYYHVVNVETNPVNVQAPAPAQLPASNPPA